MASAGSTLLLLGATQGVGESLIDGLMMQVDLTPLTIHAVSRTPQQPSLTKNDEFTIQWHAHDLKHSTLDLSADWVISAGPVGLLLHQLEHWGEKDKPRAVWALSSASPDFKSESLDAQEREQMKEIEHAEQALIQHCQSHDINLQLYKTTMLYGRGDRNINRLADLMARFRWLLVTGNGQRAPVHVADVAALLQRQLMACLSDEKIDTGTWRLQGGESFGYRVMLERIAKARDLKVRVVPIPAAPLVWLLRLAHATGHLKDIKAPMLARQAMDLTVDDSEARAQLNWAPGPFRP